jgi:hypothetical protein
MKKIITVLFFAGFFTTAFAQDDRGDHYGNQYSENYQRDNRHGDNGYSHDAGRENWHREYRGGDDREYRDRDDRWRSENNYPEYENHEMMENYAHRRDRDFPWMEIRLSRHNRESRRDGD